MAGTPGAGGAAWPGIGTRNRAGATLGWAASLSAQVTPSLVLRLSFRKQPLPDLRDVFPLRSWSPSGDIKLRGPCGQASENSSTLGGRRRAPSLSCSHFSRNVGQVRPGFCLGKPACPGVPRVPRENDPGPRHC